MENSHHIEQRATEMTGYDKTIEAMAKAMQEVFPVVHSGVDDKGGVGCYTAGISCIQESSKSSPSSPTRDYARSKTLLR